jgi:hypothetical protein
MALGLLINLVQFAADVRPVAAIYATGSVGLYLAAVLAGFSGRRYAFFWASLAVSLLHLAFSAWYFLFLIDFVARLHRLPQPLTLIWNLGLFSLAGTLCLYLVLVERPRMLSALKPTPSQ